MTLFSFFALRSLRPLRLAGFGSLACAVVFSGCHVHVDRPCCKFNWRVSVCGLTANCHECRNGCVDCETANGQPTLAPAPVVQTISDLPFSVALAGNPTSGLTSSGATPAWQEVTPTVVLPSFPTQQTAAGEQLAEGGAANIATTLNAASDDGLDADVETLELNFGPADSRASGPAPQLLVPQQEPAPAAIALPSLPTNPVRARARDASPSNTLVVEVEAPTTEVLPELQTPHEFASANGSGFVEQNLSVPAVTGGPSLLRLTAIPKLSPNNFPPLVTIQPAPLDPTAEAPVPYQIVIAPLATEPNRRPIEPRLEAQRVGSVLDVSNTLRR